MIAAKRAISPRGSHRSQLWGFGLCRVLSSRQREPFGGPFSAMALVSDTLLAATFCFGMVAAAANAADPDALWNIVHGQCAIHTAPCAEFDLTAGYALLKDRVGVAQYLVLPTAKITGIEDPQVLAPSTPNLMAIAWDDRRWMEKALGKALPRDAVSLAINSRYGRSQNQMHIHIDCIRPDVHAVLVQRLTEISSSWTVLPQPLQGHTYSAMRIMGPDLKSDDPLHDLAKSGVDMGAETLVVVGATFSDGPGFILLSDHADLARGDRASGEELQDHDCSIAKG